MRIPGPLHSRSWRALVAIFLLVCVSWSASAQQQQPPSTPPSKDQETPPAQNQPQNQAQASSQSQREPESGEKIRQRTQWFYQQRAYPIGHIPAGARQRALEHLDRMRRDQALQQANQTSPQERQSGTLTSPSQSAGIIPFPGDGTWHLIGPQPTNQPFGGNGGSPTSSGRVTALAVDPTDTTGKTVFLGSAAGGIWRTTDGGATWTALTDTQASLAIGSLAIAPSNHLVIYAGTGEDNFNGDAYQGAGVLTSSNGGNTWAQTCTLPSATCPFIGPLGPALGGARIGALAVSPSDPNTVLAGVAFGATGSAAGIYRSTDGGATWTKVLGGDAGTAVVFDPGNANIAYAALGFPAGDPANGIYTSTNGGATWTKLGGGLPASTSMGRIELTIAPSTTGVTAVLYAAIADGTTSSSGLLGFFQSSDGGSSWTQRMSTPNFCGPSQCFYDIVVRVHPTNSSFVVVGGSAFTNNSTTLFKSTDGGVTWSDSTTNDFTIGSTSVRPHVDTHALAFAANGATPRLYVGNDGGVWRSDDPTPTHPLWVDLNATLAITQFYGGHTTHPSDENVEFGGTQDNDTEVFAGTLDWTNVFACGDGGFTAIDRSMPSTVYTGCDRFAAPIVLKSVFNGVVLPGPFSSFFPAASGIIGTDRMEFIPPLAISRNQSSTLFFGTCRVSRTTNSASSWAAISGDLSSGNVATACPSGGAGNVSAMDAGNNSADVVYAGTSNGKVWKTLNATSPTPTWTEVTQASLPPRHVTAARSKRNDSTGMIAYATFSGFGLCAGCDGKGHVFKTSDGGATWTDISHNLPDIPVNDIVVDHNGQPIKFDALYIATDIGVFTCQDPEAATPCTNWLVEGTGLPRVPVLSVALREQSRNLRAATHGRSVWNLQLTDIPLSSIVGALMTSISPATAIVGSASITVAVSGVNFTSQTAVRWNGSTTGVTTTFVDANHLTALIDSSLLTTGTVAAVDITDPNGVFSANNTFAFTVTNPVAVPSTISPGSGTVGVPVTLHITGSGFVTGIDVIFNGIDNTNGTVSAGGTVVDITIPGSELTAPGPVHVTLSNPLPGGGSVPGFFFSFTISPAAGGAITMNPASVNFGNQPLSTASSTTNVVVTNSGAASVTLNSFSITGTNAGDFTQVAPTSGSACNFTGGVLAVGGNCSFGLRFTPSAAGARSATVNIANTGSPNPQTLALSGNGAVPTATLSPGNLTFGSQAVGTTSAVKNETIQNTGSDTLNVTSIVKGGANPGDFNLVAPTSGNQPCNLAGSFSLSPGNSCDFGVNFAPTVGSPRSATVTVTDNSGGTPGTTQVINLNGTGTSGGPAVTFAPTSVAFGNQRVGTTSAATHVHITSSGTATLNITGITLTGTNPGAFSLTSAADGATPACPLGASALNAVNTCNVDAKFAPTSTGAKSANISVADDAPGSPQTVPLSGTGTTSSVSLSTNSVAFGNQRVGNTSAVSSVTVTNNGTATLNISTVVLGGGNPGDFATASGTTCTNGSTVAVSASCVINLTFTPTVTGARAATVTLTDDASPNTQTITLSGTGTSAIVALSTNTVNFGNQPVSSTSGASTVTVTNNGTATLNISTVALGGTNASDFAIIVGSSTCTNGSTVAASGGTCAINLTFTPAATGARSATVTLTDDASPNTQTITLNGTGTAATVTLSTNNVAFGNQRVGTTSAAATVTLTNGGTATLHISAVVLAGTNAGDFALASPATTCVNGATVTANGGTCVLSVTFTPSATGARSATVTITDDAAGSPRVVTLTGTGTVPAVTLNPTSLDFGNQIILTTSAAQTVTLTNSGTATLNISSVALGGANASEFALANGTTCTNGSTVAAGANCVINVTFTPATAAAKVAMVTISDDATPATQTINLSGTGVTPPTATLSSSAIAFGNQRVGTTSAAQSVTVTNNGGAPLSITTVAITGTNAADFALATGTTCTNGSTVNPAQSCTINVTFTPAANGARAASVTITDNAAGSPHSVALTGNGIASAVTLAPQNLAFGNQRVGTSASLSVTLTNSGTATLNLTSITITGTNPGDFSVAGSGGTPCPTGTGTVAVGNNCTFSVTFKPTATGARSASVSISDDAANSPQNVPLTGTGIAPAVALAPASLTFAPQAVGTTSAAQSVTLTNSGTDVLHTTTVAITGANAGDFAIAAGTTCVNGGTVVAAGTCTISVTFTPAAIGIRVASVTVTDDASGSPHAVPLSGATPPAVNLSATSIAFGTQAAGTTSAATNVTLTNTGGSNLNITTVAVGGANAADFALASPATTCTNGSSVAPNANCVLSVTFKPGATGARAGTITITDNAPGSPHAITLTGNGVDFAVSGPPAAVTVAAGGSANFTITVSAQGGTFPGSVSFSASGLPAATAVTFNPPTVNPGSGSATTTMTIATTQRTAIPPQTPTNPQMARPLLLRWLAALLSLASLALLRRAMRTRRYALYLPMAVLLLSLTTILGCSEAKHTGTPAGTSTITVTAASGSVSHTTTVTLTVQ